MKEDKTYTKMIYVTAVFILFSIQVAWCGNIDPNGDGSQYAWGENIGWLNFDTRDGDVNVADSNLTGYVWAENVGWIDLDPNIIDPNVGIKNDGTGLLSGYAWGENVGWINFNPLVPGDPNHYGVTVDTEGEFDGYAWGENIGWVKLNPQVSGDPNHYGVITSWTTSLYIDDDDLSRFVAQWLFEGLELTGDLDSDEDVDFPDYAILANKWLEKCPPGWPLAY
ncbi:MAG: hypothetical protein ACYSSL_08665 [Planctomycetota bacterium]|jgi:hypothetical protein